MKLSDLDVSKTNLKFNPQHVYQKDLSNCTVSDYNLTSYDLTGVNTKGSNIESICASNTQTDNITINQ